MSKRNELYSFMKLAFRPKQYRLNAPFYHRLDDLFSRRFPDTPLPQRRRLELKKNFDKNIVLPLFIAEENNKNFSIKTIDSESITTNKISEDIINYIVSVADLSEKAYDDTHQEALEQERVFLNVGEILNKVFLLFKYLRDDKGIKCHAVENIIKLEAPFREATLLMCMSVGNRSGRAGKVFIICPQRKQADAYILLESFKDVPDSKIKKHFSLFTPPLSYREDTTDIAHGKRCYLLALPVFDGAIIASENFKLESKIGNIKYRISEKPNYFEAIKIAFIRKMYRSPSGFFLSNLYASQPKDKRLRKKIREINKYFDDLRRTEKNKVSKEINKVITWTPSATSSKDRYEYKIVKTQKHFLIFSKTDSTYQTSQIESLAQDLDNGYSF